MEWGSSCPFWLISEASLLISFLWLVAWEGGWGWEGKGKMPTEAQ